MIPQNIDQWLDCIVNRCKITLTKDFVKQRLTILRDTGHPETRGFIKRYGILHLENVVKGFKTYEQ